MPFLKKTMNKLAALRELIQASNLLSSDVKEDLLRRVSDLTTAEIDMLGKALVLAIREQKEEEAVLDRVLDFLTAIEARQKK